MFRLMSATMMMLVFIRHGQTDWNVEERYQGRLDIPLNDVGRRQAEALKCHLAGVRFDTAYSSPLRRALETAHIITNDLPIIVDERLAEIDHGLWQGRTKAEIASRWPEQWEQWSREPLGFTAPRGESAARVRERVEEFLSTIEGKNILCVSHGVVIQTLLSILLSSLPMKFTLSDPLPPSFDASPYRARASRAALPLMEGETASGASGGGRFRTTQAQPLSTRDTYTPANGSIHTIHFRGRDVCDYRIEQIS